MQGHAQEDVLVAQKKMCWHRSYTAIERDHVGHEDGYEALKGAHRKSRCNKY